MKKTRGVILFFLSLGTAVMADTLDEGEIQSSRLSSRPADKTIELISSPVLESVTQKGDTPMRLDTAASPGADQRVLDPRFMEEIKVVYPEAQPSWWECVCNYLFGD